MLFKCILFWNNKNPFDTVQFNLIQDIIGVLKALQKCSKYTFKVNINNISD